MAAALTLNQSTIGKKAIMAVTGIVLYGFVIVHMIGNLKIFEGPTGFNEYSHFLRVVGEPALPAGTILWVIRMSDQAQIRLLSPLPSSPRPRRWSRAS